MIQKKQPEQVSFGAGGRMNRTGIGTAPRLSKRMVEPREATPGGPQELVVARRFYLEDPEPIGTMPPSTEALSGNRATVFIDKMAERLAFERTGTRLYQAILNKHDVLGTWDGGPTRTDLERFCREELQHFHLLRECIESAGADPTVMTPSADVVASEGSGLLMVIADPRTTLAQSLHALLVAELADKAGWELLIELGRELGQDPLVQRFVVAEREEAQHLLSVRRWVATHTSLSARI